MNKASWETKGFIWFIMLALAVIIGVSTMIGWKVGVLAVVVFLILGDLYMEIVTRFWAEIAFKKMMSGEISVKELFCGERGRRLLIEAIKDFFRYTIGYKLKKSIFGEAEAKPLFNLKISREYDGLIDWREGFLRSFERDIDIWHETIKAAKQIIGWDVHVDARGRLWPGRIERLPARKASLNVPENRSYLFLLWDAFNKGKALNRYEMSPHIYVEADEAAGLRAEIYQIYFDGHRAYLYEIDRNATEAKEMRQLVKKLA